MFKRVGGIMKAKLAILCLLMFTGFTFGLKAVERYYASTTTIMHCMDYDEVYDARGNLKNPRWYIPFEERILTDREYLDAVLGGHVTSLVSRRGGEKEDKSLKRGVPTMQFSHQFITTRPSQTILKKMGSKGLIPKEHTGPIVQVCRVYHIMEPQELNQIIEGAPESMPKEKIPLDDISDDLKEEFDYSDMDFGGSLEEEEEEEEEEYEEDDE